MYTVIEHGVKHRFVTFEEVVKWAWNNHMLDFEQDHEPSEQEKQVLCDELSLIISNPPERIKVGFDGRVYIKED